MKIFLAVIKTIFKRTLHYRLGLMMSIVIHPIYLILNIFVFTTLYRYTGVQTLAGYNLAQIIWYQAGNLFIWSIIYNESDWVIATKIISGDLVQDLLKPISLFKYELASSIGMRLMAICLEFLPDMIILPLFYFPSFMTAGSILRFIPVAVGAFLLFYHISFLVGLLAFAMKSTKSLWPIRFILIWTLGGGRLPLDFFPPVFNLINSFFPFRYIFYYPLRVFINMPGTQTAGEFLTIVGAQAAWILGLHVLCRLLWRGAYRKFCAVGG
jgi:ABC-2 type transport system permease protein